MKDAELHSMKNISTTKPQPSVARDDFAPPLGEWNRQVPKAVSHVLYRAPNPGSTMLVKITGVDTRDLTASLLTAVIVDIALE
jgi:hypothetical protein